MASGRDIVCDACPRLGVLGKVRARDGEHRIRLSPLKGLLIGEFEFDEGDGYVQIEAEGAVGPVYIGALRLTPIKLEPPKYITANRLLELTGERKKIEQAMRDIAKTAKGCSDEPFRPADWLPATRVLEKLPMGKGTVVQFFRELTMRYDHEPVIFDDRKEWEEFITWIYCRCWALDLKDKWCKDILNRPFKPLDENITATVRRLSDMAKRLKAVTAEIEGL